MRWDDTNYLNAFADVKKRRDGRDILLVFGETHFLRVVEKHGKWFEKTRNKKKAKAVSHSFKKTSRDVWVSRKLYEATVHFLEHKKNRKEKTNKFFSSFFFESFC